MVLSGFEKKESKYELHKNDTKSPTEIDRKTGEAKTIFVPILEEKNFGEHMAIDEKNIAKEIYTIISNRITGKIALMIMTTKIKLIKDALYKLSNKTLFSIKSITMDLAQGYDDLAREVFMNAIRIGDKFHVVVLAISTIQDVRIRFRQEALTKERERIEAHKSAEAEKRSLAKQNGETYKTKKAPPPKKFENDETEMELLARSRYLLFKFKKDWTSSQSERAEILFREFPEIKKAYRLICSFRSFYNCSFGKKANIKKAKEKLNKWVKKSANSNINEIENFISTVQNNKQKILNYFEKGETNAYAESLNNRIQRFIIQNYGIKNRDFFHYRLKLIFA